MWIAHSLPTEILLPAHGEKVPQADEGSFPADLSIRWSPPYRGTFGAMRLNRRLKCFARRMRHAPTRGEERLWSWLRERQFRGCKFRRQYPAGRYILDFYCPALKLAIELDGRQHQEAWTTEYDFRRSRYLEGHGVRVLRISNELFIRDAQLVFAQIGFVIDLLMRS